MSLSIVRALFFHEDFELDQTVKTACQQLESAATAKRRACEALDESVHDLSRTLTGLEQDRRDADDGGSY